MKIAITTDAIYPFTLGGSEIRNHEVAKRLVKKGHKVHIYGAKLWKGKNTIKIDNIAIHGVCKYKRLYTQKGKRNPLDQLKLSIMTFLELQKQDFDVIDNLSFVFLNCYATKLASLTKKTSLVFTWQQYFGDYLTGYFGKTLGTTAMILEKLSTKLTKNHIAVSKFVKKELLREGGWDKSKKTSSKDIQIIYNGTDVKTINKIPKQKTKYDIIFVGRLNYQKNLPLLIKSIAELKKYDKSFKNIKVAILGDGEKKQELKDLIKKLNLEKNFIFLGKTKNKQKIYKELKSAKIFTLPSILEGFPLTIIEANAAGLPVITTKTKHNRNT